MTGLTKPSAPTCLLARPRAVAPPPGGVLAIQRIGGYAVRLVEHRRYAMLRGTPDRWRVEVLDDGGGIVAEHKLASWTRARVVYDACVAALERRE